ncbi:MAG: hypothetical protein Unbinned176contig1000_13 [Prokaryotic dsDNA virus sp.]|nr:MAG: hypothetical protein Unbinned176contig1000_13 [Prokaryotic dsDNA virus sp.]|tara:strand:+ start:8473 stop:9165 length:693 start_codon:yes stop_codon:yes gene_type:complete
MKLGRSYVWNPTFEQENLVYWLQHNSNLTTDGSLVTHWASAKAGATDRWSQSTANAKPTLSASVGTKGGVDFDGVDNHLIGTQFTLNGEYVMGVRFTVEDADAGNDVLVGDITSSNNFLRLNSSETVGIKHSSGQKIFTMDAGSIFTAESDHTLVIARDSGDIIRIWMDGVLQTDTETAAGNFLVDGLGARASITNFFSGVIYEVCIFDQVYSPRIAERLSEYLMSLKID